MSYETMKRTLENALYDLSVLAGDRALTSDASWQDVAGSAAAHLRALAYMLDRARDDGAVSARGIIYFPSPAEALERKRSGI